MAISKKQEAPSRKGLFARVAAARLAAKELAAQLTMSVVGVATWNWSELKSKGIKVWASATAQAAKKHGTHLLKEGKAKSLALGASARKVAADKSFQATTAGATSGAVTLGATGGAAGLTAGTVIGAAVGLVPALFTFGLSIPIGAAIGGTTGLVTGAAAGSTMGAVGGGAAGYGVYTKREQIGSAACQAKAKVQDSTTFVKGKVVASAEHLKEGASALRSRIAGSRS